MSAELRDRAWAELVMPWERPGWRRRGEWHRRHERIWKLEYDLGLHNLSWIDQPKWLRS